MDTPTVRRITITDDEESFRDDVDAGVDVAASAARYREVVEEQLADAYPGAVVEWDIRPQVYATNVSLDGGDDEDERMVLAIHERVWGDQDFWVSSDIDE
jgi:hypothetical protein